MHGLSVLFVSLFSSGSKPLGNGTFGTMKFTLLITARMQYHFWMLGKLLW
jgi:hypothetical protein